MLGLLSQANLIPLVFDAKYPTLIGPEIFETNRTEMAEKVGGCQSF
jgi:hypothetical protein